MTDNTELLDRLENWFWPIFGCADAAKAIRALEEQVKELEALVHKLKQEPSTPRG